GNEGPRGSPRDDPPPRSRHSRARAALLVAIGSLDQETRTSRRQGQLGGARRDYLRVAPVARSSHGPRPVARPDLDRPKGVLWEALHSPPSDLGVADPRSAGGRHVSWDVLREYPQLEEADVRACIAYGAEM